MKTKSNYINDKFLNNFIIINPIEFLTEKQNNEILNSLKQSLQDENDSSKWTLWEEFEEKELQKDFI